MDLIKLSENIVNKITKQNGEISISKCITILNLWESTDEFWTSPHISQSLCQ